MSAHKHDLEARALLAERIAGLPAALAEAATAPLPGDAESFRSFAASDRFIASGGGLSEGPARVLVALLRRMGRDARFVSQSELARIPDAGADVAGAALVLFSQGLAPNARLPLSWLGPGLVDVARPIGEKVMARGLLVTSVQPGDAGDAGVGGLARRLRDAGHLVWTLPPREEGRLLLRVIGPAVSTLAAIRLAHALAGRALDSGSLATLNDVVARALNAPAPDLFGAERRPIALIAEPALVELMMPLRWKLLEGLRVPDPPVWDPLQVAHGPLQSIYDERVTLLVLRTRGGVGDARDDALFGRLRAVLRTEGEDPPHRWLELRAVSAGPLAVLELDARLDAALLATLARHPLALDDWPARGLDGPIYDADPLSLQLARQGEDT
jgi:hypothetical protein